MRYAVGAALGIAAALAMAGGLRGLLYGIAPLDAGNLMAVATLVFVAVLTATSVPAWRAASVDPSVTLRNE